MTAETAHAASQDPPLRPRSVEWWLIAAVCLTGFALRAAWPSRLAVEHFDEGVYASNIFFSGGKGDEHYPDQQLYAPPLVPLLIEFAMLMTGPSNLAAMGVNIAVGSLTIPLVWWVGRRWFGPVAGLVSATFVALNDVHIFFSRTALTDVPLCCWLVTAVYFFWEALTTHSRLALFAAGAATGLAWWTKYNGWLPLAIGLAGLIARQMFGQCCVAREEPRPTAQRRSDSATSRRRSLGSWAIVASIAALVWAPWLWSLQSRGGYARVAQNHSGYFVGLYGWWDAMTLQAAKLQRLDGALSHLTFLVPLLACFLHVRFSNGRCTWNALFRDRWIATWLLLALLAGIACGTTGAMAVIAAAGIVNTLSWRESARARESNSTAREFAGWMLAAWFMGLLVTIPLYTPYPRLTLPWLMACWLGGGAAAGAMIQRVDTLCRGTDIADGQDLTCRSENTRSPAKISSCEGIAVAATLVGALIFCGAGSRSRGVPGWQSRTSLVDQAPLIDDACHGRAGIDSDGRAWTSS